MSVEVVLGGLGRSLEVFHEALAGFLGDLGSLGSEA